MQRPACSRCLARLGRDVPPERSPWRLARDCEPCQSPYHTDAPPVVRPALRFTPERVACDLTALADRADVRGHWRRAALLREASTLICTHVLGEEG